MGTGKLPKVKKSVKTEKKTDKKKKIDKIAAKVTAVPVSDKDIIAKAAVGSPLLW